MSTQLKAALDEYSEEQINALRIFFEQENARLDKRWEYQKNAQKLQVQFYHQRRRANKYGVENTLTIDEWNNIIDNHGRCCHYCGDIEITITIDHIIPLSRNGGFTKDNVLPACKSCNSAKGVKNYDEFVLWITQKMV